MPRFQLSLNVSNVDESVEFYSKALGVEPAKHRSGYANFSVESPPLKLVLIEGEGAPGTINHLGIEHASAADVAAESQRLTSVRVPVDADECHTCCFATQEKAWATTPEGLPWEIYTVVADTDHFGASPRGGTPIDFVLPPVSLEELSAALHDDDVVVIDAQGDGGYEERHIDGAVNFSLDDVVGQAENLLGDTAQRVVLYCTDADCLGAEFVGTQLVEQGYTNVGRFPGGVEEWEAAGQPVVKGSSAA